MMEKRVAIIGGGAAGCFCAIEIKRLHPTWMVTVYEAATKLLAKVAVTGGGRCNLTNSFRTCLDDRGRLINLQSVYPRGDKLMRKVLSRFSHVDTYEWFENEGVKLVTQDDECVFPVSQDAMEIVRTLTRNMYNLGVKVSLKSRVTSIVPNNKDDGYVIEPFGEYYNSVVVTTGGSPKTSGLAFLDALNLDIVSPVPSLFTFNIDGSQNALLMGTVVENVTVSLAGTKHKAHGPLLWTHWGVSGPAILKLSSYAARDLAATDYKGTLIVNWYGDAKEQVVREELEKMMREQSQKIVSNVYPTRLTQKHWNVLLDCCSIPQTQRWGALNATHVNRLVSVLTSQQFVITGRNKWKEEFVTCGGVSLTNINPKTLACRQYPGVFFAGEVLDIDAVTGGYNLQAAWSTARMCAENI